MKRKKVRKIIYFIFFLFIATVIGSLIYVNFFITVDTAEIDKYYNLLSRDMISSNGLVLSLGVKESDDLQVAVDRLKAAMGLEGYKIWLGYDDKESPPAYIKNVSPGSMIIMVSKNVKQRREQINLLVHELGHIYVWKISKSALRNCDEEKVVDCSGTFLGLGILTLNGLTDDFSFIPGGEYIAEKKMFGYLKPEQFGYLLARYCREHGIAYNKITPFLNSAGRKYFNIGCRYLARVANKTGRPTGKATGIYWCQECGQRMKVDLAAEKLDLKCPKCSKVL